MQIRASLNLGGFELAECLYRPGSRLPVHAHARTVLCVALQGQFREHCEGRAVDVLPGDVLLRPANCTHENAFVHGPQRSLVVELSADEYAHDAELTRALSTPQLLRSRRAAALGRGLARAWSGLANAANRLDIEAAILQLLAECVRQPARRRGSAPPAWLNTVVTRIRAEFHREVSLAALADDAGVHRVHLARTFRRHQGRTIGAYVRHLRLGWVEEQLLTTDRAIADLAAAAGFADQSHMARWFRAEYGLSPSALRRSASGKTPSDG
ncbi:MAG: AraC family transcriptional regulator [Planctomycetota bacterium]